MVIKGQYGPAFFTLDLTKEELQKSIDNKNSIVCVGNFDKCSTTFKITPNEAMEMHIRKEL